MTTPNPTLSSKDAEILRVVYLLATAAFALNSIEALSGEPCQATFSAMRKVLRDAFGAVRGDYIEQQIMASGEFQGEFLARHLAECTPCGCKCAECVLSHLDGEITPLRHGLRGDREFWTRWAVFSEDQVEEVVSQLHEDETDVAGALTGFYEYYRGPGYSFAHAPSYVRGKYHTLVTWTGGLDV